MSAASCAPFSLCAAAIPPAQLPLSTEHMGAVCMWHNLPQLCKWDFIQGSSFVYLICCVCLKLRTWSMSDKIAFIWVTWSGWKIFFQHNPTGSGAVWGRFCLNRLSTSCLYTWYTLRGIYCLCSFAFGSVSRQNISGSWQKLTDSLYILLSLLCMQEKVKHIFYLLIEAELSRSSQERRCCTGGLLAV